MVRPLGIEEDDDVLYHITSGGNAKKSVIADD